jgi:hypothetical protein
MGRWSLRLRAAVDENRTTIIAVCLLLTLLGGWATHTAYASPGMTVEDRVVSSWQTSGQYNHSATVLKNNTVFDRGETLRNRPMYFTTVAPTLNGLFRFSYTATERGNLTTTTDITLIARAVERGSQGAPSVLWQQSWGLAHQQTRAITPGERVTVPFSVNVTRLENRTNRISQELGGTAGETEILIRATVSVRGRVNDDDIKQVQNYTIPLSVGPATYSPGSVETKTHREETTRTVRVPRQYGLLWRLGGPFSVFVGVVGLLASIHWSRKGGINLSSTERDRLTYEDDRADFDEWISTIRPPEEAMNLPQGSADSLAALVDFAIDTNNSVLEHPDTGMFYVVHDGYCYTYDPPRPPRDDTVDAARGANGSAGSGSESETTLRDRIRSLRQIVASLRSQIRGSNDEPETLEERTERDG